MIDDQSINISDSSRNRNGSNHKGISYGIFGIKKGSESNQLEIGTKKKKRIKVEKIE